MAKISIIVPVYNTEEFLKECLDSIQKQSYSDFEVILVDDGSVDNSGNICDIYASEDERFKVIHKNNEGVSKARNTALDVATGEYICFVDSDDTIECDMLKCHLNTIDKYNADIVMSDREICSVKPKVNSEVCFDNRQVRRHFFQTGLIRPTLPLCLFRTSLFNDIRFPTHIVHWEDFAVMACILNRVNRLVVTDSRFYYYRMRSGSATHQKINPRMMTCFSIDDFLNSNKVYKDKQERRDVISFFLKFGCFETFRDIESEYTSIIRKKVFYNILSVVLSKSVLNKTKLVILLYAISPHWAMKISRQYQKKVLHISNHN